MTEADWLAATDPAPMLDFLRDRASGRRLRLFACACCRRVLHLMADERSRAAVGEAERHADRTADPARLGRVKAAAAAADRAAGGRARGVPDGAEADGWGAWAECSAAYAATRAVARARGAVGEAASQAAEAVQAAAGRAAALAGASRGTATRAGRAARGEERRAQAALLRCVVGNPFRPVAAGPSWLTPTVLAIAEGIYAEGAFDRLPILADALQDAGCEDPDVLGHCRGPGPHARGCWVVDLVLGKQ
jgi:hypothetical protein